MNRFFRFLLILIVSEFAFGSQSYGYSTIDFAENFLSLLQKSWHFVIPLIFLFSVIAIIFLIYRNNQVLKKEISRRTRVEQESQKKGENLERALSLGIATLESTADGILVVDENRKIAGYNQKFANMWNIPSSVLVPGNDNEAVQHVLKQLKDPDEFIKSLERLYYSDPGAEYIDEVEFKDGKIFERYTIPQRLGDKIIGRVFSFRDITKRKQMEEQLIYQATHDALTLLPNRVILLDRIKQAIKYSRRSHQIAAVLFFDLDRFKLVNDSLGHDLGDILLQSVARRLEHCVRENDTVARWGGDEFVILLTSLSCEEDVIPIVNKCLESLGEVFVIDKFHLNVTTSVGISFFPKDGQNPFSLLKNADSAMYFAKSEGHNTYKFYTQKMNKHTREQLELANDLHNALVKDQLTLHYQPLIDLKNNSIVGVEALLRWYHPSRGLISAKEFIPIAEDTGLILSIGEWVLRKACFQNKFWQEKGLPHIFMSVNLSGQQFKQKNVVELVNSILKETRLDPKYLEMELTESVIMENTRAYLNYMKELKKIGVGISIDDFGTGYSSLSYLKRFPVDKIKIDQSFITDLPDNDEDAAIVRAILALAKHLNLQVVAEGIETESQLSFLRKNGCNVGQGYLFSKPIPSEAFAKLLKKKDRPKRTKIVYAPPKLV
jgi:diguanylate cyclase (GGDEF)-like protein